jgi:hypothetical protein
MLFGHPVPAPPSWPILGGLAGLALAILVLFYNEALKRWVVHPVLGSIERVFKP